MAGTSYKILEVLSFFDLHNKNNHTNSSGKKIVQSSFPG